MHPAPTTRMKANPSCWVGEKKPSQNGRFVRTHSRTQKETEGWSSNPGLEITIIGGKTSREKGLCGYCYHVHRDMWTAQKLCLSRSGNPVFWAPATIAGKTGRPGTNGSVPPWTGKDTLASASSNHNGLLRRRELWEMIMNEEPSGKRKCKKQASNGCDFIFCLLSLRSQTVSNLPLLKKSFLWFLKVLQPVSAIVEKAVDISQWPETRVNSVLVIHDFFLHSALYTGIQVQEASDMFIFLTVMKMSQTDL